MDEQIGCDLVHGNGNRRDGKPGTIGDLDGEPARARLARRTSVRPVSNRRTSQQKPHRPRKSVKLTDYPLL